MSFVTALPASAKSSAAKPVERHGGLRLETLTCKCMCAEALPSASRTQPLQTFATSCTLRPCESVNGDHSDAKCSLLIIQFLFLQAYPVPGAPKLYNTQPNLVGHLMVSACHCMHNILWTYIYICMCPDGRLAVRLRANQSSFTLQHAFSIRHSFMQNTSHT